MIIAGFVHKMTAKLSDLLPVGKGINVEVRGTSPSSNTLRFRFADGGYFTLVNKVVTVWNHRGGEPFNRFPTTFHDAVLGNGTKVNNPSEATIKLAFGGVDIRNKPLDPSLCPASGKPWPQMTTNRGGRIAYRACPECGATIAFQNMYGETPFKIRKHKKKESVKESADILTIFSWLKRNRDLFDKKDLIRQLMSRFHIDKDVAIKYIERPLTEVKMIAFNKYKLHPEDEDALMWLIAEKRKDWEKAKDAKDAGRFNKLATIMELAKFYEQAGFLTQKQVQLLEKWGVFAYKPKKKESFGGSYARPSNYPVQSGLPPTTVKEAFGFTEEYDAEFAGWQSWPNHDPLPLYNITKKGHEKYRSTVSPKTLDQLGLKYQPPPPYRGEK